MSFVRANWNITNWTRLPNKSPPFQSFIFSWHFAFAFFRYWHRISLWPIKGTQLPVCSLCLPWALNFFLKVKSLNLLSSVGLTPAGSSSQTSSVRVLLGEEGEHGAMFVSGTFSFSSPSSSTNFTWTFLRGLLCWGGLAIFDCISPCYSAFSSWYIPHLYSSLLLLTLCKVLLSPKRPWDSRWYNFYDSMNEIETHGI